MPKKKSTTKPNSLHEAHEDWSKRSQWYSGWHEHPSHKATHWMILITIVLVIGGLFYLRAQTPVDESALNNMEGFASSLSKEEREQQISEATKTILNLANDIRSAAVEEKSLIVKDLVEIAKQRKQLMKDSIKDNPGAVKRNTIPKGLKQQLPDEVQLILEEERRVSGSFIWMVEGDHDEKPSENFFVKENNDSLVEVNFVNWDQKPPLTGYKVSMDAVLIDNQAVVDASDFNVTGTTAELGTPTTAKKVAVIMVNFPTNTTEISTREYVQSLVYTGPSSVRAYYQEASFGQWTIEGKNNIDGDIYGWYTVPYIPPTSYTQDALPQIANYARQAAAADGFNASGYTNIIYYMPNMWAINGVAYVGGVDSFIDGDPRVHTTIHELGHNYTMGHAGIYYCSDAGVQTVISGSCSYTGYGDPYAVMSNNSSGHVHGLHKSSVYGGTAGPATNWIDSARKVSLDPSTNTGGVYTLEPIETSGNGTQVIQILREPSTFPSQNRYLYLEYRQPIGWDSYFANYNSNVYTGVSLRIGGGYDQYNDTGLIDIHPSPEGTGFSAWDAALQVGEVFNDPDHGITIRVLSVSPAGAQVEVLLAPVVCRNNAPVITLTPTTQTGNPGGTMSYNYQITNKDTYSCGAAVFSVTPVLPSGWFATPSSTNWTLAPGGTAYGTINITSSSTATGSNSISVRGAHSANSNLSNTASATFVISTTGTGDVTPPSITIKSPANNSVVKKGSIKFNATVSDVSGVGTVVLKVGTTTLKTCSNTTTCSANVSVTSLPFGSSSLSVTATDKAPVPNTATRSVSVFKQ